MRLTALLVLFLFAAACGDLESGDACADDPGANHSAVNPATGACWDFASSCDVPADWQPCAGLPERECDTDDDCAMGFGCDAEGLCVDRDQGCVADADCPATQHCANISATGAPAGCEDNAACFVDGDCPEGQWCDLDPAVDDAVATPGLCSSGPSPTEAGTTCTTNAECSAGQICPAQYGGCSPPTDDNVPMEACPSVCEASCVDDSTCAEGLHCNAATVCGVPNPKRTMKRAVFFVACAGWCE